MSETIPSRTKWRAILNGAPLSLEQIKDMQGEPMPALTDRQVTQAHVISTVICGILKDVDPLVAESALLSVVAAGCFFEGNGEKDSVTGEAGRFCANLSVLLNRMTT